MDKLLTTLEVEWKKDTTRADITQELGKLYYFKEDYQTSFFYYKKFKELQKNQADLYPWENLKIGIVYEKMGYQDDAKEFVNTYRNHCDVDRTTYQPASLAMLYIYEQKFDEAIEQFQKFSYESNFHYWMILFLESDPLLKQLKSHEAYESTMQKIRDQFWEQHEEIKKMLDEKNLL